MFLIPNNTFRETLACLIQSKKLHSSLFWKSIRIICILHKFEDIDELLWFILLHNGFHSFQASTKKYLADSKNMFLLLLR